MLDTKAQMGETAGQVWHLLHKQGPQTIAELKKKLNGKSEFLSFAIGWLAREDKIDVTPDKRNLRVQLKH